MTTEAITKAAAAATYTGSASAIIFGLSAHDIAALGGLAVAVGGLLVNVYFQRKHFKLAQDRARDDDA